MDWLQLLEIIAVVFGIVSVYLLTKQKIWAWPAGIITVSIYLYIFYVNKLYSDAILHFIYILLNIYGWWNWLKKGPDQDDLPVTRLRMIEIGIWSMIIIAGTIAWGYVMDTRTDADYAFPDAFTTTASLVAQYLLARKKIDNWIIWIIVDIVAINIYLLKGLYFTSFLYLFYLGLCVLGIKGWRKSMLEMAS